MLFVGLAAGYMLRAPVVVTTTSTVITTAFCTATVTRIQPTAIVETETVTPYSTATASKGPIATTATALPLLALAIASGNIVSITTAATLLTACIYTILNHDRETPQGNLLPALP